MEPPSQPSSSSRRTPTVPVIHLPLPAAGFWPHCPRLRSFDRIETKPGRVGEPFGDYGATATTVASGWNPPRSGPTSAVLVPLGHGFGRHFRATISQLSATYITTFNRIIGHRFPCIKWTADERAFRRNGLLSPTFAAVGRRGAVFHVK